MPFAETTPLPTQAPSPKETDRPSFRYEAHAQQVQAGLRRLGFKETASMITAEGIDRSRYIAFARSQLGLPETGQLPNHIGEVAIPSYLKNHATATDAYIVSVGTGLGHARVARSLGNTIEVLGGSWTDAFLGGDKDVLPTYGRFNPNKLVHAIVQRFHSASMDTAEKAGMSTAEKDATPSSSLYNRAVDMFAKIGAKLNGLDDPNDIFKANDIGTLSSRVKENPLFWGFRFIFKRAIKQWEQ